MALMLRLSSKLGLYDEVGDVATRLWTDCRDMTLDRDGALTNPLPK
jgi:hypothetical protein